jgi:hypothetical protein
VQYEESSFLKSFIFAAVRGVDEECEEVVQGYYDRADEEDNEEIRQRETILGMLGFDERYVD